MRYIQSTLLIPVVEASESVNKWRVEYQDSAKRGMPAHITLFFPFLHPSEIGDSTITQLTHFFKKVNKFTYQLNKIENFPLVVYLAPTNGSKFTKISQNLATKYPQIKPYEGEYLAPIPHCTLARMSTEAKTEEIKGQIETSIKHEPPISCDAHEAWLMYKNELNYWGIHEKFRFKD
jgi:2'-5' RNA ligase